MKDLTLPDYYTIKGTVHCSPWVYAGKMLITCMRAELYNSIYCILLIFKKDSMLRRDRDSYQNTLC